MLRTLLAAALIATPLFAIAEGAPVKAPSKPKNLVIMVGDGMGPAYTTAYRYFKDNPDTEEIEQTVFDRLLVGMATTYPAPVSGYVTDSAAAATALATGQKTYNGAISVDVDKAPLPTLMEKARQAGLVTGIAVSSQINHATPAAFLSHNESRKNYDEIAKAYLDSDAQVMLGGGQKYFDPELLGQFIAKGYTHVTDMNALSAINGGKVIGLFAEVQLPWAVDNPGARQLSTLTAKALELLSQNEQGFVLLVEGSLIDWAGHNNDIVTAMGEMDEFARAIEVVEEFVRSRGDTLMVVTADHNTGGLSIGADGEYEWDAALLRAVKASPDSMAAAALASEEWHKPLIASLGFALESDEWDELTKARADGQDALAACIMAIIDKRSHTGWTSGGHTAMDVQVFAQGPAADLFNGSQDNTDIANKMMSLLPKVKKAQPAKPATATNAPASEVGNEAGNEAGTTKPQSATQQTEQKSAGNEQTEKAQAGNEQTEQIPAGNEQAKEKQAEPAVSPAAAVSEPQAANTKPVDAEPVKVEPEKAEPVKPEPVKSEPVNSEPAKSEPEQQSATEPSQALPESTPAVAA